MPVSGIRVTFIFEEGRYGFSETHVYNADTIQTAMEPAIKLAKFRKAIMGPPAILFGCRLSKEGVYRDSRILDQDQIEAVNSAPYALTGSNAGVTNNAADQAKACILLRLEASDLSRKPLYLAGTPDDVLRQNPESPPTAVPAPWRAAYDIWKNELINAPWGFIGRSITAGEGIVPRQVLLAERRIADNLLQLTITTPAPQFLVAQKVQLRNFKMLSKVFHPAQGQYAIDKVEPDVPLPGQTRITLRGSTLIDPQAIKDYGTIELVDFTFRKYARVVMERQTTRKRGNRFLAGPGRRTVLDRI